MKKLTTILLILITSITISHAQKFKLTGQIIGAEKGDTLRFDKLNTRWEVEAGGFDVIIGKNGEIKYRGKQEHTQQYAASYFPINGEKLFSDIPGLLVFITDGTIKITGTREHIYYSSLEGGVYDSELNKIRFITDSLGKIRSNYWKFMATALAEKDTIEMQYYSNLFNNFYKDEKVRARSAKAREMEVAYDKNNPNEYVASKIAMNHSLLSLNELKQTYESFSHEVKESYYGQSIKQSIETIETFKSGQPAPDFKLITTKGDTITLNEFKGKYLLINHFGICPGSIQMDKYVVDLYDKHKDQLNVIGYISSLHSIKEYYKSAKDGDKVALNSMLNHPWEYVAEYESIPENMQLKETYKFIGLPYFIFISPEGKMIGRGYSPVFFEASNVLKNL